MKYQYCAVKHFRFSELIPIQMGYECCEPNNAPSFTPFNTIIHYIYKGSGIFTGKTSTYTLMPGQAFVMFPYQTASHVADGIDPWEYGWIEFAGASVPEIFNASKITMSSPIITDSTSQPLGKALMRILDASKQKNISYQMILARLWEFSDTLLQLRANTERAVSMSEIYINQAISYIHSAQISSIDVSNIAKHIGIDRSYLTQIFKKQLNIAPQKYIVNYKMTLAKDMLLKSSLTLADVSEALGYSDPVNFFKAFKKNHKLTPTTWRKISSGEERIDQ